MDKNHAFKIQAMFDRISPRYDLLNRIISGGKDIGWRKKAVDLLGDLSGATALDLCCGSGDFLAILLDKYSGNIQLYGIDFAPRMLNLARNRFKSQKNLRLLLSRADAMQLPLADSSIDAITMGFGIRNIADRDAGLREIHRVLKPGGKLVMIEPSRPPNRIIKASFLLYFKYISPVIGGIISGDRTAYKYLHNSFAAFPRPAEFLDQMKTAGYSALNCYPQFMGTAMIYYGEK